MLLRRIALYRTQDVLKIESMADSVHLNFDNAWATTADIATRDFLDWGPRLRYFAPPKLIETFYYDIVQALPPFVLYGSGDFHHLAALLIRRFAEPLHVISFDNHPDWDVRAPYWGCGAWVSRALEIKTVEQVSVWGCGNFELAWPSRWFANRKGLQSGKLKVNAWAERQSESTAKRFDCMTRGNWQDRFLQHAESLKGTNVYVTVDLDCLREEEAATNWENGLYTAREIRWAIEHLRSVSNVLGGDVCGAWSKPVYAGKFQRVAGGWDHPKANVQPRPDGEKINRTSLETIWPALVNGY